MTVNISSHNATILWMVPYLTYTPEEYTVYFGVSESLLDQRSEIQRSSSDLGARNEIYSLIITQLRPNTDYYFQIHSVNSYSETVTDAMNFTTIESGMYIDLSDSK